MLKESCTCTHVIVYKACSNPFMQMIYIKIPQGSNESFSYSWLNGSPKAIYKPKAENLGYLALVLFPKPIRLPSRELGPRESGGGMPRLKPNCWGYKAVRQVCSYPQPAPYSIYLFSYKQTFKA